LVDQTALQGSVEGLMANSHRSGAIDSSTGPTALPTGLVVVSQWLVAFRACLRAGLPEKERKDQPNSVPRPSPKGQEQAEKKQTNNELTHRRPQP
jgi:hypothetical protein